MIPYSTDAPIYHLPIGTFLLIFANIVCFAAHGGTVDEDHRWVLQMGEAPNPMQWLTSMFAHIGPVHLVGNLYFLGIFGLIVEGKLGILKFIPLYFTIGLVSAALTQLMMWPVGGPPAVGAEAAVMGLMTICLVWAPQNELSVFTILPTFFVARGFLFEISLFWYGVMYIIWGVFVLMLTGLEMSAPLMSVIAAAAGFGAGALYVKKGWVDCENWDLFAVMAGTHGRFGDETTTVGSHADAALLFGKDVDVDRVVVPEDRDDKRSGELTYVNQLIDDGMFFDAASELLSLQMGEMTESLTERRLRRLAGGLHDADAIDEAQMFLDEYEERFEDRADWCRLRLAHLLLHKRKKPAAALRKLKLVRLSRLTEAQQNRARKIVATAKQQVRSGVKDAVDELDWDHS